MRLAIVAGLTSKGPARVSFSAMRLGRAICVSLDEGVCRVVADALTSAGLTVEHTTSIPADVTGAVAVIVDRATRLAAPTVLRGLSVPVVVVGDDLDDDGLITLMLEGPVSHLVRDPGDPQLQITSEKLATGDMFGLEKYVSPGVTVGERLINTDSDKRHAIDEVCAWAEAVGARRPIVARISSVVDELVMNALRESDGDLRRRARGAVLRWAKDDGTIAISVGDRFGTLRQHDVLDHVRRARTEKGRPQSPAESQGAGLGLYLVLANVASLIVNVTPGEQTEVVCLFDLAAPSKRGAIGSGVRSLHVFQMVGT